jgi:hypothetical protein
MGEAFALSRLLCHFLVIALMCSVFLLHQPEWTVVNGR